MKNFLQIFKMTGICVMHSIFIKRNTKILVLLILLMFSASIMVSAQAIVPLCGAGFNSVSSLDNSASESEGILEYFLSIENLGTTVDIFQLTTLNIKPKGNNPDGSTTAGNISLKSVVFDEHGDQVSTVSLDPGKQAELTLRVFIPNGLKTGVWNCTQVKAVSSKCGTETVIQYSTYIPSSEDSSVGFIPMIDPISDFFAMTCILR